MSGARNDRGVALVLVLWVFMTLGVLALDFSQYMHDDALAAINFADETRGYYAALAAMNHVLYDAVRAKEGTGNAATPNAAPDLGRHLTEDQDQEEAALPADGQWHDGTFQGIAYKVRMTDQGGLIPINRPDEALLRRVITNLVRGGNSTTGIDRRTQTDIDTVVDSILDWRDRDHLRRAHGAESQFYLKRNGYPAKDGLFDSPEELLLVRGVTAELFYGAPGRPGLRDVISIYTNRGGTTGNEKMNVRYMPTAVMQVLLGIDPDAAE